MRGDKGGFTVLELMVAVFVAGAVVLGVSSLFGMVADTADRLGAMRVASDRTAGRLLTLRELLGQVEAGADSSTLFEAREGAMRFTSWCRAPGGWSERCVVTMALVFDGDSVKLVGRWLGSIHELMIGVAPARLEFLRRADGGGEWLSRWGPSLAPPLAVRALLGADTAIIRIGPRG